MATAAEACTLHWLGPGNAAGDAAFNLSQLFGQHGDRLTVGRTEAAVLVRKPPAGGTASADLHRHISRRNHAAFTLVGASGGAAATLMVTDPGSTHGTFVGGMRLPANEPQALANDDVVSFGDKPVISFGTVKVCSESGIQERVIPICCAMALPFTSVRQERSRNARQLATSPLYFNSSQRLFRMRRGAPTRLPLWYAILRRCQTLRSPASPPSRTPSRCRPPRPARPPSRPVLFDLPKQLLASAPCTTPSPRRRQRRAIPSSCKVPSTFATAVHHELAVRLAARIVLFKMLLTTTLNGVLPNGPRLHMQGVHRSATVKEEEVMSPATTAPRAKPAFADEATAASPLAQPAMGAEQPARRASGRVRTSAAAATAAPFGGRQQGSAKECQDSGRDDVAAAADAEAAANAAPAFPRKRPSGSPLKESRFKACKTSAGRSTRAAAAAMAAEAATAAAEATSAAGAAAGGVAATAAATAALTVVAAAASVAARSHHAARRTSNEAAAPVEEKTVAPSGEAAPAAGVQCAHKCARRLHPCGFFQCMQTMESLRSHCDLPPHRQPDPSCQYEGSCKRSDGTNHAAPAMYADEAPRKRQKQPARKSNAGSGAAVAPAAAGGSGAAAKAKKPRKRSGGAAAGDNSGSAGDSGRWVLSA